MACGRLGQGLQAPSGREAIQTLAGHRGLVDIVKRLCDNCGRPCDVRGRALTCSPECRAAKRKRQMAAFYVGKDRDRRIDRAAILSAARREEMAETRFDGLAERAARALFQG